MSKIKIVKYSKFKLKKLLPYPDKFDNKYTRGRCIILAGNIEYPGASVLCTSSAIKSGAGYTMLYTHKNNIDINIAHNPSVVAFSFNMFTDVINSTIKKPSAYVVGPGFIADNQLNEKLLLKILTTTNAPVIIDGGALSCFKNDSIRSAVIERSKKSYDTIITPHAGEAEKILQNCATIKPLNLQNVAVELSLKTKTTVLLKGPISYVCNSDNLYQMKSGTCVLSKAGTGDILAGIIGGIMCQNKINAFDACVLSSNIHAQAGKIASEKFGIISVTPTDIVECISDAFMYFS